LTIARPGLALRDVDYCSEKRTSPRLGGHCFLKRWFTALLLGAALIGSQPSWGATAAFLLHGITYSNTLPASSTTTIGNGLITWTYTPGDFSNGTGQLIHVNLPPDTVPPYYDTTYSVTSTDITGQLANANVDCYWYDWHITFAPALSSPNSTAQITGGSYELTRGSCANFLGQVIGGTITPYQPTLFVQKSGTNLVLHWPTNYADGFILESANALSQNSHWTTSSIPVTVLGENYYITNGITRSTNTFFRLVR
jgi:hypothetical protein